VLKGCPTRLVDSRAPPSPISRGAFARTGSTLLICEREILWLHHETGIILQTRSCGETQGRPSFASSGPVRLAGIGDCYWSGVREKHCWLAGAGDCCWSGVRGKHCWLTESWSITARLALLPLVSLIVSRIGSTTTTQNPARPGQKLHP
jgi:hypothetical protein